MARWSVSARMGASIRRLGDAKRVLRAVVVVTAAAVAVSGVGVQPARAATVDGPAKTPAAFPKEAGDRVSAAMTAKAAGHPVEITSERTDRATTWVLPSGALRTDVAGGVIRVRGKSGEWTPVDYALRQTSSGWAPKASPVAIRFSAGGKGAAATIGAGADAVSLDWPTPLPAPTVEGATATYRLTATQSLVLRATATGYEQSLLLSAPPTSAPRMALTFRGTPKLRATSGRGFEFSRPVKAARNAKSQVSVGAVKTETLLQIPPPVMYSAAVDPKTGDRTQVRALSASAAPAAAGAVGAGTLEVTAAMDFLTDPATKYPVTIDPVIASVSRIGDTYLIEGDTRPKVNDYSLFVGPTAAGVKRRALLRFGAGSALAGLRVTNATLNLYTLEAATCTAKPLKGYPVTADYNLGLAVWGNQPPVSTAVATAASASFSHGFTGCARAWDSIDVTKMAQSWADAPASDFGLQLQGDELDTASGKRFCAMDVDTTGLSAACSTTANLPYLSVTYNSMPGTPTGLDWSPRVTGLDSARTATSLTPTFSGTSTNAGGGNYRLQVEVSHNPAFPAEGTGVMWTGTSEATTAGGVASVTAPAGTFIAGQHIVFRARSIVTNGAGGTDASAWTTSNDRFYFNINAPKAPTISCPSYPANAYTAQAAGAVTCTIQSTSTDTGIYTWSLDDPTPTTEVSVAPAWGAAASISITPTKGWHTLYATATDTARHVSTTTAMSFGVGTGAVTSPAATDTTAKAVALAASAGSAYTKVTYQWAPGTTSTTWTDLPVGRVTPNGSSTPIVAWPLTGTTSGSLTKFSGYNWDVASTLAATQPDGALRIRAVFATAAGATHTSDPVVFSLNRGVFSGSAPTAQVGPGTVSLLSGDFGVSATDAGLNGLAVSRSITNLAPVTNTGAAGVFGPGWTAGLTGAGASGYVLNAANQAVGSVTLRAGDGTQLVYTQTATNTFTGIDDADDGSVLTYSTTLTDPATGTAATGWQLKETDGTVTTWFSRSGVWQPVTVDPPATADASLAAYDTSGRPVTLLAPAPTGVTCTLADRNRAGCQWLTISYATATTAIGTAEAAWGNYLGQVSGISWTGYDPATSAMVTKNVAGYSYDSTGRLRAAWDPRLATPLKTRYTYTAAGRLASTQAAGRNAQNVNYDTSGRLASVSWTDPANGTATQAVAYGLAVSGVAGAPDVSAAATATWGQTAGLPYVGGAVFPPSQVPSLNATTGAYAPTAAQWPYGSVTYSDVNGLTVNTAGYGAGAWQIDSTRYDAGGNQTWSLSAGNRAQALSPTASTDPYVAAQTTSAARADLLAETTTYSPDGVDVLSTLGPARPARMSDGSTASVRSLTSYTYDQGAPAGGPYRLATTTTVRPVALDGTTVPAADVRVTRTGYDPIDGASSTGPTSGWTLRTPTSETVQMGTAASSADLVSRTRYDSVGRAVESRLPGGAATDANTTITTYYTAAANTTYPSCGGAAHREGLVCRTDPGGAASAGHNVPSKVYTYDLYGQVLTVTETSGTVTRTSTATYDAAGRPATSAVAVTGLASSAAVPAKKVSYDPATGDATTLTAGTASLSATFDALGRQATQIDADANTSTYTYDIDGNVKTLNDGKGTSTYTYNTSSERRGVVTSINTGMGALSTFTGSYDAGGSLVSQTYPNGTVATYEYDNIGTPTSLRYTLPTYSGGPAANTLSFSNLADGFGQTTRSQSPASAQDFSYDYAGRLTKVADTYAGACTSRVYGFDKQSDRTSLTTYGAASTGTCQATNPASTKSNTFDNANRITNTGYTYDQLGRTLTVPATDLTTGTAALAVSYYDNEKPRTQTQGANGKTFTLDPADRYRQATDTTSGTETRRIINHYSSAAGDSPAWIASSADNGATWTWERHIRGLDGSLAATQTAATTPVLHLANLHGDIVATVPNRTPTAADPTGATPTGYFESTEYGTPRDATITNRYTWLGTHQRSTDTLAELTLMGVRLYNPATGRFLTVDPIHGGNENAYTYPVDPISEFDLDGRLNWGKKATWKALMRVLRIGLKAACAGLTVAGFVCAAVTSGISSAVGEAAWAYLVEGRRVLTWRQLGYEFWKGAVLGVGGKVVLNAVKIIRITARALIYVVKSALRRVGKKELAVMLGTAFEIAINSTSPPKR